MHLPHQWSSQKSRTRNRTPTSARERSPVIGFRCIDLPFGVRLRFSIWSTFLDMRSNASNADVSRDVRTASMTPSTPTIDCCWA